MRYSLVAGTEKFKQIGGKVFENVWKKGVQNLKRLRNKLSQNSQMNREKTKGKRIEELESESTMLQNQILEIKK